MSSRAFARRYATVVIPLPKGWEPRSAWDVPPAILSAAPCPFGFDDLYVDSMGTDVVSLAEAMKLVDGFNDLDHGNKDWALLLAVDSEPAAGGGRLQRLAVVDPAEEMTQPGSAQAWKWLRKNMSFDDIFDQ